MIELSYQTKRLFNQRVSIVQILEDHFDLEIKEMDNYWMISPCPISGSTDAFRVLWSSDGEIQVYKRHNGTACTNPIFTDLPEVGTAADLLSCIYETFQELVEYMQGQKLSKHNIIMAKTKKSAPAKIESHALLSPKDVIRFHKFHRKFLTQRHIDDWCNWRGLLGSTLNYAEIGWSEKRKMYTYPCKDEEGTVRHIRFREHAGDGRSQLKDNNGGSWFFPTHEILNHDSILFVEGEHDALACKEYLNIPALAICGNFGEKSSRFSLLKDKLKSKRLFLAFDNDEQGEKYRAMFQNHFGSMNEIHVISFDGKDPDEVLRSSNNWDITLVLKRF